MAKAHKLTKHTKFSVLIFTAESLGKSPGDNHKATLNLQDTLKSLNINSKQVSGRFEGQDNTSFVVPLEGNMEAVKELAFNQYDQDSILEVDKQNNAILHQNPARYRHTELDLGKFTCVSRQIAEKMDSYTKDRNYYYITVKA